MDSHHDQVMRRRAQAAGGPARTYFAYSTILDHDAFAEWKEQHGYQTFSLPEGRLGAALDLALVYDFPSRWWGGRVAGLADQPGARIWGRVFTVSAEDWAIIQHKEGAITGMCVERPVRVEVDGQVIDATAFTTAPNRRSTDGPISDRFVEALRRGAQAAGLPADYLASLTPAE